jgi:hypothetical protein
VRGAQNAQRDFPRALPEPRTLPEVMGVAKNYDLFYLVIFDILVGNRVQGTQNAHREFPRMLPETVGVV